MGDHLLSIRLGELVVLWLDVGKIEWYSSIVTDMTVLAVCSAASGKLRLE